MTPEDRRKLEEVYQFMQNMGAASSIPFPVEGALKERIGKAISLSLSLKDLNSEDVSVNESGASTYAVLGDPDGFLEINISGTVYYVPYFL